MKAKQITKLRLKIANYKKYWIEDTDRLFGSFGIWGLSDIENHAKYNTKASSHEQALRRYLRWYKEKYKERHEHDDVFDSHGETVRNWAHFVVIDENGYKKFYQ